MKPELVLLGLTVPVGTLRIETEGRASRTQDNIERVRKADLRQKSRVHRRDTLLHTLRHLHVGGTQDEVVTFPTAAPPEAPSHAFAYGE